MDNFKLKVFAITVMLIDHIGAILISPYTNYWLYFTFRAIGRLAFPIFVFLMIEGFYHTRDIKKYLIRMGMFAVLSEIPFDLAFYRYHTGMNALTDISGMFRTTDHFAAVLGNFNEAQNVFFTLFLGLLLITLMDLIDKKLKDLFEKKLMLGELSNYILCNLLDGLLTIAFCYLAYVMKTDYDMAGVLLIVAFYLFRESKLLMAVSLFIIMAARYCNFVNFWQTGNFYSIISILATLAIIPIAFYNGQKGKSIKYFFYIFYPAHLFCLFLISLFL